MARRNNINTPLPTSQSAIIRILDTAPPSALRGSDIIGLGYRDLSEIHNVGTLHRTVDHTNDGPRVNVTYFIDYSINFDIDIKKLLEIKRAAIRSAFSQASAKYPNICNVTIAADGNNEISQRINLFEYAELPGIKEAIEDNTAGKVLAPVTLTFNRLPKFIMDSLINPHIRFDFFSKPEGRQGETKIAEMEYKTPLGYSEDKELYFTVRKSIKITAAAIGLNSTKIEIFNRAKNPVDGVKIYRREMPKNRLFADSMEGFSLVRDVDFINELDTAVDEACNVTIFDREVRNTSSYIYRAIPYGFDGAPSLVFYDAQTRAIDQSDIIMGEKTKVLAVSVTRSSKDADGNTINVAENDYALTDDNFMPVNAPAEGIPETCALVSRQVGDAILVTAANVGGMGQNLSTATFLRRNLSKGERIFKRFKGNERAIPVSSTEKTSISARDTDVQDEYVYEYIIELEDVFGVKQKSKDTTLSEYINYKMIKPSGATISAVSALNGATVDIDIDISLAPTIMSLLAAEAQARGEGDIFLSDTTRGRADLNSVVSFTVKRFNHKTGVEREFRSFGSDASKFSLISPTPPATRPVGSFKYKFTDSSVTGNNDYTYDILLNLRKPLAVTDVKVYGSTHSKPFIWQYCKINHPIFTKRGILPPTAQGQNFIRQNDLNSGARRLLNRYTPKDEYALGEIAARSHVPTSGMIQIPKGIELAFSVLDPEYSRPGMAKVEWTVSKSSSNISHFEVVAEDEYVSIPGLPTFRRMPLLLHYVPADERGTYKVEDMLPRLIPGDENTFSGENAQSIDAGEMQSMVDDRVYGVKRSFEITAIYLNGTRGPSRTTKQIMMTAPPSSPNSPEIYTETGAIPTNSSLSRPIPDLSEIQVFIPRIPGNIVPQIAGNIGNTISQRVITSNAHTGDRFVGRPMASLGGRRGQLSPGGVNVSEVSSRIGAMMARPMGRGGF
jgi:hypothetical protein